MMTIQSKNNKKSDEFGIFNVILLIIIIEKLKFLLYWKMKRKCNYLMDFFNLFKIISIIFLYKLFLE